ncbi:DUF5906 domain-containing protein [Janthinobacterium sp. MDB2-8]|uniref:DUF5906 domain-containing protein n=1 Tax=Janthinobacterium sp. MDB2-8 TaxID=1259338 RepID=UPI003F221A2B
MSDIGQVILQMSEAGLPDLPPGHPKIDGKIKRFGKKNKAWYVLRETTLSSGRQVVTGAFGIYQGLEPNTVKVSIDMVRMSSAEIAESARKQREQAAAEDEKAREASRLAANRANDQWNRAEGLPLDHPYLTRKQITPEGVRVGADGVLLIPFWHGKHLGGLQKISQSGDKQNNKGSNAKGASLVLGTLAGAPLIGVGEGYATSRTVRMLANAEMPVVNAFTAGNIKAVVLQLRKDHPKTPILIFADDDYLLEPRFRAYLQDDLMVSCHVPIDGATHTVLADDGERVEVMARWLNDARGVPYISADMRKGRLVRTPKFENAGIACALATAAAVDNVSVAIPRFVDRAGRKLSDFNDLAVEESFEVAGEQIGVAILAAQQPKFALPVPPAAPAANSMVPPAAALAATGVSPVPPAAQQPDSGFPDASVIAPVLDLGVLFLEGVTDESPPPPGAEQPARRSAVDAEADDSEARLAATLEAGYADGSLPEPPDEGGSASAPGARGEGKQAKDKPKKVYGADHWNQVEYVLKNFVLVYGEDLVWDVSQRMLMKISSMRTIVANNDVMKFWGGEARRWVLKKNIVFDPQDIPSPASSGATATVNLFNGWAMQPRRGSCLRIQTLIAHLCDGNDALVEWVERWLAYPLRNRGAKMETSIIMHGDEGSGKNFFFEKVIKKIYGEYGYVIGNAQLESQFNDWASMKLFMVADEVVTRSELKHMKGKLKYLVSGDMIIINPKGLPEHGEANHMNFVFLSNELQPLALDKTDRRYLVIWTPPALSREFYVQVAEEIANGGIEAYYHYLMHELDMGDFDEHTKPIYTDAKDDLIEKSLTPAERFYRDWSRGFLPLPFITCGATQLYDAYKVWCDKSGESKYISQTIFSPTVLRYAGEALEKHLIKYELGSVVKQRNVFLAGKKPEGKTLTEWAADASGLFEKSLRAYRSRSGVDAADVEG